MMKHLVYSLLIMLFACSPLQQEQQSTEKISLSSPDGKTKVSFLNEEGKLSFTLSHKGTKLLDKSNLGLQFGFADFSNNLRILGQTTREINESYEMVVGKRKENHAVAYELDLTVENADKKQVTLVFRAYNEGIAFRYDIEEGEDNALLEDEATAFNVNPEGLAWLEPYQWASPVYEQAHEAKIPVGTKPRMYKEEGWSFPALFNVGEQWMLISESDLDGTFAAAHLHNEEGSPVYKVAMPTDKEIYNVESTKPTVPSFPWKSPWRTITVGSLEDIFASNLNHHVARPSIVENTDWIKPGKAAWTWLTDMPSPKDYKALAKAVDATAEMGWEYTLVDANWEKMGNGGDIHKLIKHAEQKNVGLFLWYNSGGPHNAIGDFANFEGPRDLMHLRDIRRKEFKKLQEWGVKGVKVDFFGSDKQEVMQLTLDVIEDAADFEIMVNIHGCTFPKGWQRTYPHLVTAEAVKGSENFLYDHKFEYESGRHNATLPFTRNTVASADYTPVVFSQLKIPRHSTHGHQLALSIVFESGFFCLGEKPSYYPTLPKKVNSFLKEFPTTWDDSKLLGGYPGKECYVARRKGNDWYVAGINGYYEPSHYELDLGFLGEGMFEGQMIGSKAEDGKEFTYTDISYPSTKKLNIDLAAEDGFVIKFTEIE